MVEERDDFGSDDPTRIRSIAVTVDDAVTALEARERGGRRTILRITPPFYGRMRARLHLEGAEGTYDGDVDPIHVAPTELFDDDAPAYPEVDETADRLGSADDYTTDELRDRHVEVVDRWREAVRDYVVDSVTLDTPSGPHTVDVKRLG